MEAMFLRLAEPILGKGVLGLAVLALAWVVLQLYRQNSDLHDRLLQEREKRVDEAKASALAVQAASHEVKEMSALLVSRVNSLQQRRTFGNG